MRLIDADELIEHAMREKLDSRELILQMIEKAPTINLQQISGEEYRKILRAKKEEVRPNERDSDWWYNRKAGMIDGLEIAFETFMNLGS